MVQVGPDTAFGLDDAVKVLIALLGGGVLKAVYDRLSAKETNKVTKDNAELVQTTERLKTDLEAVKSAQVIFQAYAEGQSKKVDSLEKTVEAERERAVAAETREAASLVREADCHQRLGVALARLSTTELSVSELTKQVAALKGESGGYVE